MEDRLEMPPQEALTPFINKFMAEWIERNNSLEVTNHIYDQYRLVDFYGLLRPVIDYSAYFGFDDEDTEGKGPRIFTQGMLLGFGIAHDWLPEEEIKNASSMLGEIEKEFTAAGNEIVKYNEEEPNWADVLLNFGQKGVDMVHGYRHLVEMCLTKIDPNEKLHPYFRAGAGLAMRIALAERTYRRRQEVEALNDLFATSSGA